MAPSIRSATADDGEAIFELMYREPLPEVLAMTGGLEQARAFGRLLPAVPTPPGDETFVCEVDSRVVGMLQVRPRTKEPPASSFLPGLVRLLITQYPAWAWAGMLRRLTVRARLQFPPVDGACHIVEIHVDPERRNLGTGAKLIRFAEEYAGANGCTRLSLSTTATSPARRLYERSGFRVVDERTDREYESATGIPGRVLMVKELAGTRGRPTSA
jgi:ribosomal protein S18 acetylase RimI-like enzyme